MTWLQTTIGQVCLPITQRDPSTEDEGAFSYIDISGIDREAKTISRVDRVPCAEAPSRARKVIRGGDVLVSTVRPNLNAVAQVPDALDLAIASTGFAVLRARPEVVDARYLFYRTQHQEFVQFLTTRATGANYPAVSDGVVRSAKLPLPPLSEQRRIVEILDEASSLKDLRREADSQAARILPALFVRMFGDPATNPMGWPTDRLDRLFDVVGGGTPAKAEARYWGGDIPWASPKDMKRRVITQTEDHITAEAVASSATRLVKKGSVLIVYRSGILAHTFPVALAGCDLTLNQDLKALTSKGTVLNEYLYGWLTTASSLALGCVKKGATVHNVDGSRFLALPMAKPPQRLQEDFARHLDDLLQFDDRKDVASARVESLFGLALQRAFAGEITAGWREGRSAELLSEMEQQASLLNHARQDRQRLGSEA